MRDRNLELITSLLNIVMWTGMVVAIAHFYPGPIPTQLRSLFITVNFHKFEGNKQSQGYSFEVL